MKAEYMLSKLQCRLESIQRSIIATPVARKGSAHPPSTGNDGDDKWAPRDEDEDTGMKVSYSGGSPQEYDMWGSDDDDGIWPLYGPGQSA